MHAFHLEPRMLSMTGGFYPRGYCFVMFPAEQAALRGEHLLDSAGIDCSDVSHLTPDDVLSLLHTFDRYDVVLPSWGSDGDTMRQFADLARAGHHALLIPARSAAECQRIAQALHGAEVSCAVHYRNFVIEDLTV